MGGQVGNLYRVDFSRPRATETTGEGQICKGDFSKRKKAPDERELLSSIESILEQPTLQKGEDLLFAAHRYLDKAPSEPLGYFAMATAQLCLGDEHVYKTFSHLWAHAEEEEQPKYAQRCLVLLARLGKGAPRRDFWTKTFLVNILEKAPLDRDKLKTVQYVVDQLHLPLEQLVFASNRRRFKRVETATSATEYPDYKPA